MSEYDLFVKAFTRAGYNIDTFEDKDGTKNIMIFMGEDFCFEFSPAGFLI